MIITGRYDKLIEIDDKSYKTTFILVNKAKEITVCGFLYNISEGMDIVATGEFDGVIFNATKIKRKILLRSEAENVLAENVPGLSEKKASLVIDALGNDIFTYLDNEKFHEILGNIRGIGSSIICNIERFITKNLSANEDFNKLTKYGLTVKSAMKILKDNKVGAFYSNPYKYLNHYDIPFEIADKIALSNEIDIWDFERIKAIIKETLRKNESQGNTTILFDDFIKNSINLSSYNGSIPIPKCLFELFAKNEADFKVYKKETGKYISFSDIYKEEELIASRIKLINNNKEPLISEELLENSINEIEKELNIKYNNEQRNVFNIFTTGGIGILTGGPGTGKTTVINGLIRQFKKVNDQKITLIAPTGRASSRMSEISNEDASTIHRQLKLSTDIRNENKPIEMLDKGLVIVDEISMCDTFLFGNLIKAIASGSIVILSGDVNQLPSIGAGEVFKNIIESGKIPIYELKKIIRQGELSGIVKNSHNIITGKPLETTDDFIIRFTNEKTTKDEIKEIIKNEKNIQILTPIRKTSVGSFSLSKMVRDIENPNGEKHFIKGEEYRIGDSVIMNTNNYDEGYINGDIGTITEINNGYIRISFKNKEILSEIINIDSMSLSYAITVHKFQGSEAENIIIVLPKESVCMASVKLLYTAITRAKKKVYLFTDENTLFTYLNSKKDIKRSCNLDTWLKEI